MMARARLALIWARREFFSGEQTLLVLALMLAVCAMSAVGFLSERIGQGLNSQASQLLAADLVLNGDRPLPLALRQAAQSGGLMLSDSTSFPSMVQGRGQAALASFQAVDAHYPLRGQISVRLADGRVVQGQLHPAPGTVWADPRLMTRLNLGLGDTLGVGSTQLRLAGEIVRQPDALMDLYNFVPRLMLNQADLPATGLIAPGTRARWRLMLAGSGAQVGAYAAWVKSRLPLGAHLEDVAESRPELRDSLTRARRFLGLSAMFTVVLCAAAVALAVRRYLARNWQNVALLRTLGMTAREIGMLFAVRFLLLALCAGVLGTGAGYLLQRELARLALASLADRLPAPGVGMVLLGPLSALLMLVGLGLPPLLALCKAPPLAVLRADLSAIPSVSLGACLALLLLLALAAWQVADLSLALWLLLGLAAYFALASLLVLACLRLARRMAPGGGVSWRYGVASLSRRPGLAALQIVALSIGLMSLLTLTVARNDLIDNWRHSLAPDAPNQFVINLQPEQRTAFLRAFSAARLPLPELAPMLRARLLTINAKAVNPRAYRDDEARRLAEREFNLSWRATLPPGNRLSAGQWWGAGAGTQFSVEAGLAAKLGIALGDRLSFDVAGTRYDGVVSSLRVVPWDSMRVNFFVLAPPGPFSTQAASLVSSFHLGAGAPDFSNRLVRQFPNITLIDVSEILAELRDVVDRLARAVQALFALALAGGVLVLWVGLSATRDERLSDASLLRALGATRRQLRAMVLLEMACLGAMAGFLAGAGAMALSALARVILFNLPLALDWTLLAWGGGLGVALGLLTAWPLLYKVVRQTPLNLLRTL